MTTFLRRFHLAAVFVWAILVIPTILWWRQSVPWVAFMSVWANLIAHFGAYMAARAEKVSIEAREADVTANTVNLQEH